MGEHLTQQTSGGTIQTKDELRRGEYGRGRNKQMEVVRLDSEL